MEIIVRNLIEYLLKEKGIKQKQIAEDLGVSAAQVSKWKKGEPIPYEREEQLKLKYDIYSDYVSFLDLTKTKGNAEQWISYISYLNELTECESSDFISDDPDIFIPAFIDTLLRAGFILEKCPPDISGLRTDEEQLENYEEPIYESVILEILNDIGMLEYWVGLYVMNDAYEHDELLGSASWIEDLIPEVAIMAESESLDSEILDKHIYQTFQIDKSKEVNRYIDQYCRGRLKINLQLEVDYYELIDRDPFWLYEEYTMFKPYRGNRMDQYLSYGEDRILEAVKPLTELLIELHYKVDTLLSDKDKRLLNQHLELTKPAESAFGIDE